MLKEKVKRFALTMKAQLKALYLASRDPRTPWQAKWLVVVVVAYALSPIDLIPDFIPILGYVDDLLLLPLGIYLAIKLLPEELWRECQLKAQTTDLTLPKNNLPALIIILCWVTVIAGASYGMLLLINQLSEVE